MGQPVGWARFICPTSVIVLTLMLGLIKPAQPTSYGLAVPPLIQFGISGSTSRAKLRSDSCQPR